MSAGLIMAGTPPRNATALLTSLKLFFSFSRSSLNSNEGDSWPVLQKRYRKFQPRPLKSTCRGSNIRGFLEIDMEINKNHTFLDRLEVDWAFRVAVRAAVQLSAAPRGAFHSLCGAATDGVLRQAARVVVVNEVTEHPAIREWHCKVFHLCSLKINIL